MIDRRGCQRRHRVTGEAVVAEIIQRMVRICDAIKIGLMAGVTVRCGSAILSVLMTIHTGDGNMCPGQWKRRRGMVERGGLPCCGRMTRQTFMGELRRQMIRRKGFVEFANMTIITDRGCTGELTVLVARFARRRCMRSGDRKRRCVVIERRRFPGGCGMTGETFTGEL